MILRLAQFLIIFLSVVQITRSQNTVDSLRQIWQNESEIDSVRFNAIEEYYTLRSYKKPDSVIGVANYHYDLASRLNNRPQMVWSLNKRATMNRLLDSLSEAERLFEEALSLARELNDLVMIATLEGNLGINYARKSDYQEAIQLYTSALKSFQENHDAKGEGHMLNNLGGIYFIIGDFERASEYYSKSLEIFKKRGIEDKKTAILLMNLGGIQQELDNQTKAEHYFLKALDILDTEHDAFLLTGCHNTLADIYLSLGDLTKAQSHVSSSLEITKGLGIETGIAHSRLMLAKVTLETDANKATRILESLAANLPKGLSKKAKKEIFELLYKRYKDLDKPKQSLEMHEHYVAYADSLQEESSRFAVIRETVKNEFELKLFENRLENEKEQTALKLKQMKINFAIVSGATLLIGLILFYARSNNIKNRKRREALLDELERLKVESRSKLVVDSGKLELNREKIEASIDRKLNETDWNVLNILLEHNLIPNKEIAEKAFMSVDGIGSSLRRMYGYFEIKDSKYKKISLLTEAIKRSNEE